MSVFSDPSQRVFSQQCQNLLQRIVRQRIFIKTLALSSMSCFSSHTHNHTTVSAVDWHTVSVQVCTQSEGSPWTHSHPICRLLLSIFFHASSSSALSLTTAACLCKLEGQKAPIGERRGSSVNDYLSTAHFFSERPWDEN